MARLGLRGLCCLALALALGAWGCAPATRPAPPKPVPLPAPAEARDILGLPQDLRPYLSQERLDEPLIPAATQLQLLERFRQQHFAPWGRTGAAYSRQEALWGLGKLKGNRHYGENLRLLGPGFRAEMEALARAESYPSLALPAIATANAALRVVPTSRPGFLKPTDPGEGYPFDYWQNSGIWAGLPLLVTHLSADGAWALVESRFAGGWVRITDIAFVDQAFMERWMALPLLGITRENTPLAGLPDCGTPVPGWQGNATDPAGAPPFLFHGRIGTVLPLAGADEAGYTALAPVRGPDGRALIASVRLPGSVAAPLPLAPSPRNFALLAGQMLGQPYGWGGYLDNRDCSALLLDLYAPFGIFLPRNSRQQMRAGDMLPLAGLAPQEKEQRLLDHGVPLLTLIHKPGHIMLYIGRGSGPYAGRAMILHAIWGLKTQEEDGRIGRFVIGRTAITTLEPGAEVPSVARAGTLLATLDTLTFVAPGLAPVLPPAIPPTEAAPSLPSTGQPTGQPGGQTGGQAAGQPGNVANGQGTGQ